MPNKIDFGGGLNWLDLSAKSGSEVKVEEEFGKLISSVVHNIGGDISDIRNVINNPILRLKLARLIRNPSLAILPDFHIEWRWQEIVSVPQSIFKMKDLVPVPILLSEEARDVELGGNLLCKRAISLKVNRGLFDAKFIRDNYQQIPDKFRGVDYMVFPGTILRNFEGELVIMAARWKDLVWQFDFYALNDTVWGKESCFIGTS